MKRQLRQLTLGMTLIACLMGSIACESTSSGKKTKVRSAHSNWIEEQFQTEIVNIGLEKLGYEIEKPKEIDYPIIYVSVANGDLDYSTINYEKSHIEFFENAGGGKKLERVGVLTPDGVQGYQIDKKTADKYNITNLQQFKDPKIAKLFDTDGNGKANLIGCNPGWFCEVVIDHHLKAYGLEDTVEHIRGQYIVLLADVMTRYKQGESIMYYTYQPHWISTILKPDQDIIWLEVPFTSLPESQKGLTEKDTSVDGKNLGFTVDRQRIVANKKFLAANPVAKRWFELVQIPAEDINVESLKIKEGESSPEDIRRHAKEWVENRQELFDSWVEEAKKAGGDSI
ncbi:MULTISPECIES: glycine betaine/L-proline ABC transporter substrate-binding protein ProX [unclassified Moorena]|uniref:glycine betaine/L-proline ABC transporter substrate-binding protein ProX n=1 Tax=unclassified Moorena TaxID=2683338 RepID=UPI0013B5DD43|nr:MULTISPECIES: glycine betaine/L-proline ABC transporter substrate-binding protein ProX [unclassified Moorena]NEP31918.1 glycine betaine/L-proline ABC transporter substrate-binding protein ProX [Moorena sp. SIO3B2]NEQ09276.1 glycine betaine/L-proline ABC transporter substrate-binding protein ProX [Moorena sp. SIO4E2]